MWTDLTFTFDSKGPTTVIRVLSIILLLSQRIQAIAFLLIITKPAHRGENRTVHVVQRYVYGCAGPWQMIDDIREQEC